jgi:hypothetical protein
MRIHETIVTMFWKVAAVFAVVAFIAFTTRHVAADDTAGEFVALFPDNGIPKGWLVRRWNDVSKQPEGPAEWTVKEGVLLGGEPRGTWLMSETEFGDFELEFEFKLGPLGNSGLALRSPLKGDPAFDAMELQMADFRYNPQAKDSELTGGLYRAVAPLKQVYKPTEWNRYEVSLRGSRLRAMLNGELIHDLDLDQQDQIAKRHDGTNAPPIKDRPRRGHIGFQNLSRGSEPVQIRGARIKVLD